MLIPDILPDQFAVLVEWIREREAVRVRKEAGEPWPWTSNANLRSFRWCNVRRMDDRVSRDLFITWYDPAATHAEQLVAATMARLVNWTDALMDSMQGARFNGRLLPQARARLHARAERGDKVFTGAYIVPGTPGRSKVDSICDVVDQVSGSAQQLLAPSMRGTWANLLALDGLGSFLAGQIVADLAHLPAGAAWPDAQTWAPVGPGSARGWNRLTGMPVHRHVSQAEFDVALPTVVAALEQSVPDIWVRRKLSAFDAQNCLCEGDKNFRLVLNEGKVRARYHPPAAQSSLALHA